MTLSVNGGSILKGTTLGAAYSVGLALPFLVAALGIGWVSLLLRRFSKVMHVVQVIMGVLLIVVGILLFMGSFNLLANFIPAINFGL
jgi:cytochrome c-type biogenesis protein